MNDLLCITDVDGDSYPAGVDCDDNNLSLNPGAIDIPGRYDIDLTKCIFCGFCEEACPVDAIVETRVLEYHGEKRGDLYYTKQMLLAVGERYEGQIAKDREADAKYR